MRRLGISLVLAFVCVSLFAQEKSFSIGATIGLYDRYSFGHSEIIDMSERSSYNEITYSSSPNVLPTICAEAGYVFPGNHIGAVLGAYWSYAWNNLTGGPSLMQEKENIIHVVPQIRFYYLYSGSTRMYATLGLGVRYRQFSETFEGDTIRSSHFSASYVVSPFGMSFGEKWTISCSMGHGTPWSLLILTAGYRF